MHRYRSGVRRKQRSEAEVESNYDYKRAGKYLTDYHGSRPPKADGCVRLQLHWHLYQLHTNFGGSAQLEWKPSISIYASCLAMYRFYETRR